MPTTAGVWVDHREAVLVKLSDDGEQVLQILSEAERHVHRPSDRSTEPHEPLHVPADDTRQRKYTAKLNQFYDEIITSLGHCQSILIMGPGEARTELRKRMETKHVNAQDISVEPADKMTKPQVAARVREYMNLTRT